MSTEPRLPQDLERAIFELAAHDDRRSMVQLILVAHRCRCWIEPTLYRSVVICQSSWSLSALLRTIEARPTHYAQWVKSMQINPYFTSNDPAVARILSLCTNIVSLVDLSYGRTPFAVLCQLRLERMCISLDTIDGLAAAGARTSATRRSRTSRISKFSTPRRAGAIFPSQTSPR
ncbi:hypothetical protein B0H10DRAFT_2210863 [Mycena sp. CBHHK59/15]|nr:hypothetical protein B0H10DRAFT_2210863 [Mycena sp. CBHHK59/15]